MPTHVAPCADCLRGGIFSQYCAVYADAVARRGRFPTLTTEAVALSSGGSNGILAARALWQLLLPLIIFALTALVAKWVGYVRQGLR